ncbi:siphovirus ReqiPepy6 Gp37-like family protein [Brachybacterium halotolerans subsp. kimchii]|uniref:siphovirus ReqiPepy6 Gp37-like family protein n=1 Tax=Brachybacterium halotolerans TaxID=2795215 RepID=UPI001E2C3F07|nr:siphovirus ReqiPepy6 Gp37-like family protein [Brachybacterium halotolerans]UEJ84018.1 siphovirus ReqiPepy6 Gp37-like family protein [Brachybacterium halotolerans subsp. kimchii]
MLTVWAVDPQRVRRGHLVSLATTAVLKDADVGTFQIVTPAHNDLAQRVVRGWRAIIQDGATVLSGTILHSELSAGGTELTFTGESDLRKLNIRITYPTPTQAAAAQTAEAKYSRSGPAETVIRDMIHANVGTGAITTRQEPGFTVTTSQGRGSTVKVATRFELMLEQARKLARSGGVTFDAVQENDNRIILRFRVPEDRSRKVRFTERNGGQDDGNAFSLDAPTVTTVIAGGQGLGTYRNIREYNRTGWVERIEQFLDQSSTDDDAEIKQAADEVLDQGQEAASATFTAQETPDLRFGVDYFLGDTVAVEIGAATITEPIRQAEITWDGHGRTVKLSLGDQDTTDSPDQKLVARIKKLEALARREGAIK